LLKKPFHDFFSIDRGTHAGSAAEQCDFPLKNTVHRPTG
jgi:hypothetical protein